MKLFLLILGWKILEALHLLRIFFSLRASDLLNDRKNFTASFARSVFLNLNPARIEGIKTD